MSPAVARRARRTTGERQINRAHRPRRANGDGDGLPRTSLGGPDGGLLLGLPRRPSPPRPSDEQQRRWWRLCSSAPIPQGATDLDRCYKQPPSGVRSAALGKGYFQFEPADLRAEDGRRLWGTKSHSSPTLSNAGEIRGGRAGDVPMRRAPFPSWPRKLATTRKAARPAKYPQIKIANTT